MAKAGPKKTYKYTEDFKRQVVELTNEPSIAVKEVAKNFDLHPVMLYHWRKDYRDKLMKKSKSSMLKAKKERQRLTRIQRLEKENSLLKKENDLLKKWQRYLAEQRPNDLDS